MGSAKAHNYGCYSDHSPASDFRDTSHRLRPSQMPRVTNLRPPPLYLHLLLLQHVAYVTKSHISLSHLIVPTRNALLIGNHPIHERPTAEQQHQSRRTVDIPQSG